MNMKTLITWAAVTAFILWYGPWHQQMIDKQTKWMEQRGYSSEEIRLTLEDENPAPDNAYDR
jgi:hypothetical protein